MRISHRYRFIFFSFPKTGSESVRLGLDPLSDIRGQPQPTPDNPFLTHLRPADVRELFRERGWKFDNYYRFVFIRNPWVRLVSLYQMLQREENGLRMTFAEWLVNTRTNGPGAGEDGIRRLHRRYGTYTLDSFVADEEGRRLVDEVFRLEDISFVPQRLRARGVPYSFNTFPWINRSRQRADLNQYYTPGLRAVVAMRYAKEIGEFAYVYPG
jgi:hypothetical protein